MSEDRIVIVGAGLAGLRTVERLRRLGHSGPVTLVGAEPHVPYDRPPLSKGLLTQEDEPATARPLAPEQRYADLDVDLRLGTSAVALDTGARQITLSDGNALDYHRLVLATGVRPRLPDPLGGHPGIRTLRTWEDCLALRAGLRRARHVTVIGAGVLGCEVAAAARMLDREVDLVESLPQPLARVLGPAVGDAIAGLHRDRGVRVHCGTTVSRIEGAGGTLRVVLAGERAVPTDLVVAAVGSMPNTGWLAGSGVAVSDGVLCDRAGRTSADGVYAVGDVARITHPSGDGTVRTEHWTSAADTAAVVAANLLARPAEHRELTEVPYFWSDQYDVKIQCLGLPAPDDTFTVVDGDPASRRFLAEYSRDGVVTGAVAMNMPAALTRRRKAIGHAPPRAQAPRPARRPGRAGD